MSGEDRASKIAIGDRPSKPSRVVDQQENVARAIGHGGERVAKAAVQGDEEIVGRAHFELQDMNQHRPSKGTGREMHEMAPLFAESGGSREWING